MMASNILRGILEKRAAQLLNKTAFQPMPGGQMPMDPNMGGQPPMDPSMMGGQPPMDPSMMGGQPPMDPSMMGGQPPMDPSMMDPSMMDPSMMEPQEPMVADLTVGEFKQMLREVVADVITGGPTAEAASDVKDTTVAELTDKVDMMMDALGLLPPAEGEAPMGMGPGMMGPGAGAPVAQPPMMEAQASAHTNVMSLADLIVAHAKNAR